MKTMLLGAIALAAATSAGAAPLPLVNGGFEMTTLDQSSEFGDRYSQQQVTGWQTSGYNWVFKPGEADTVGGDGEYGFLSLWGPGSGVANGMPAASPLGGNYIAADGAFTTAAIYQQLSGLTVGQKYAVKFAYAGAQQNGFSGPTTDQWAVNLGTTIPTDGERRNNFNFAPSVQLTPVLSLANHGFSGWQTAKMVFTAQSSNDILSFLAVGTPDGQPPFALLDGVSVSAVPEPASWAMLIAGFGLVGFASRRRNNIVAA